MSNAICANRSMPCDRTATIAGYCTRCYQRKRKGRPMDAPARRFSGAPLTDSTREDPITGCWLWTAAVNRPGGYGVVRWKGRSTYAHRAMYEQTYGTIPAGMDVCHTCDTPACVRPEHLWLGTRTDNMQDMIEKGRRTWPAATGSANARAILSEDDVRVIRTDNRVASAVASDYGVTASAIQAIRSGKNWSHVS